jgi:hypothetical protein
MFAIVGERGVFERLLKFSYVLLFTIYNGIAWFVG